MKLSNGRSDFSRSAGTDKNTTASELRVSTPRKQPLSPSSVASTRKCSPTLCPTPQSSGRFAASGPREACSPSGSVAFAPERSIFAEVRVHAGTSGFSYDEWHGRFYPADLPAADRLRSYSTRSRASRSTTPLSNAESSAARALACPGAGRLPLRVESAAPDHAHFAPQAASESLGYFWGAALALGDKLGPVLFQLPPFARKDAPLLAEFLASLPVALKPAFEFRHDSWFDDEIYALLSSRNAALCAGDAEDGDRSPAARGDGGFRLPQAACAELRRGRVARVVGADPAATLERGVRLPEARGARPRLRGLPRRRRRRQTRARVSGAVACCRGRSVCEASPKAKAARRSQRRAPRSRSRRATRSTAPGERQAEGESREEAETEVGRSAASRARRSPRLTPPVRVPRRRLARWPRS